jgi:hypothetical protein
MFTKSNCLRYAVALFIRLRIKGHRCYISVRGSDMGRFPHFLVCINRTRQNGEEWIRIVSFKPVAPEERKCPPAKFEGRVVWGDKKGVSH